MRPQVSTVAPSQTDGCPVLVPVLRVECVRKKHIDNPAKMPDNLFKRGKDSAVQHATRKSLGRADVG